MGGARRGPVGPGYMPKGGAAAAAARNYTWQGNQSAVPEPAVIPDPTPVGVHVRGSARVRWLTADRLTRVGAAAGALALLVEAVR